MRKYIVWINMAVKLIMLGKLFLRKISFVLQSEMAPRYEICVGLEKGHKTTPNTLAPKPSKKKVCC